jgi:toxin CcdB
MPRQFDVFPNPIRAGRDERPFLLNIQHNLLDHLATRVLAPLVIEEAIRPASRLNPAFRISGQMLFLVPTDLVTLSKRNLHEPVANLTGERDRIIAAIDLVFAGV